MGAHLFLWRKPNCHPITSWNVEKLPEAAGMGDCDGRKLTMGVVPIGENGTAFCATGRLRTKHKDQSQLNMSGK